MTEVVTLGECLVALVASEPGPLTEAAVFERFVAGAEANVAVGLARLGRSVVFVGRVGDDGFGLAIRRRLRGEGVSVDHLVIDPEATTGVMFRERRVIGSAQVVYARRGSAGSRLTPDDVDRAAAAGLFDGTRWLHITGITPGLSDDARAATQRAVSLARADGLTVSLDLNLRRRVWSDAAAAPVLRGLAADADVILGSPDEFAVVGGGSIDDDPADLARAALSLGPSLAVAKLGAAGALAVDATEPATAIARPARPLAQVVDPVGAGDAFCTGFIDARLDGADVAAALDAGNACGASAAAALGDQTGLPDRSELAALLHPVTGPDTVR